MSPNHSHPEGAPLPGPSAQGLLELFNQSLADTHHLALQAEQAFGHVTGGNNHDLRLVFDHLHGQLATNVDDLNHRANHLGDQASEAGHGPGRVATFSGHPPCDSDPAVSLNDLVDHCGEYASRMRKANKLATRLGDPHAAQFFSKASRAMDETLWMLTAHQEA